MFEMVFMPAIIVSIVKLIVSFRPHLAISTTLGCMNLKQSTTAWETHFLEIKESRQLLLTTLRCVHT